MEVNISNNDSILTTVKKLIGLDEEYDAFDQDILIYINSILFELEQIGLKSKEGFVLSDKTAVWLDYTDNERILNVLKPYVYLKTKLLFDPPTSSIAMNALEMQISEYEWRINSEAECYREEDA